METKEAEQKVVGDDKDKKQGKQSSNTKKTGLDLQADQLQALQVAAMLDKADNKKN